MAQYTFLAFFLIFLLFFGAFLKQYIKCFRLEKKLKEQLLKEKKVYGYQEFLLYMRQRIPWGGLSRNMANLHEEEDSEELRDVKHLYITNIKKARKIMVIALVPFFIMFLTRWLAHE